MTMNYKILTCVKTRQMEILVNESIDDGYTPIGGVLLVKKGDGLTPDWWLYQAVYKPEKKKRTQTAISTRKPRRDLSSAPPGVKQEVWDEFLTHRIEKKLRVTPTSYARIIRDFTKWSAETPNIDLNAILIASIRNGWTGVFRPKEEHKSETAEKLQYVRDDDLSAWAQRVGAPAPKAMGGYDYRMYRADLARWLERQ